MPDTTTWTPQRIRALRHRLGLTQEAFAQRLQSSQVHVSRLERGVQTAGWKLRHYLDALEAEGSNDG